MSTLYGRSVRGIPADRNNLSATALASVRMDMDLEACCNGDKGAWDAFVERWAGAIHSAVERTLKGRSGFVERADVDDTVQDVFLRLLKDDCRLLRSYDAERASLSTWLNLVARSAAIDRLRRKRATTVPLDAEQTPAGRPRPLRSADGGPDIPLHVLSARQRLVLRLLYDEDRSVAEAARFLGVNEQTIRSTRHKALVRLREQANES